MKIGDTVRKIKGAQWHGKIVGSYSTELTPVGWAVESSTEKGSVQIYPEAALEHCDAQQERKPEYCAWTFDDEESNTYASGCGELWTFIDGGPNENRVKCCHGCGRPVAMATKEE